MASDPKKIVHTPDKVSVWLHNHKTLRSVQVGFLAGGAFAAFNQEWLGVLLCVTAICAFQAMHVLLTSWMQTYVAYEIARDETKVELKERK